MYIYVILQKGVIWTGKKRERPLSLVVINRDSRAGFWWYFLKGWVWLRLAKSKKVLRVVGMAPLFGFG